MYFDVYKMYPYAKINHTLLWEYDLTNFDFQKMKSIVIQRVVECGYPNDWYAALNLFGEEEVKETIKNLPYLNDKDMTFVSVLFEIPITELKCYIKKQLVQTHWNS